MRIQRVEIKQDNKVEISKINFMKLDPIIEKFRNKRGNLIPILQETQNTLGYIPKEAFEYISEKTGLKLSDMYGVATFYAQFRLKPAGKHVIKVCHGTACHVQNANTITESIIESLKINDGETTPDNLFTLESVACLGCCSLAPVMMIDNESYGKLTGKLAINIIKEIQLKEKN